MKALTVLAIISLLGTMASAETVEVTVRFSEPASSRWGDCFDLLTLSGLSLDNRPGAPMLPVRYVRLLLPPDTRAVSVEVVRSDEEKIEGEFLPPPGRRETPLSEKPATPDPEPDRSIYDSPEIYPSSQAELVHQGNMGGLGIATVKIYPVRYRGAERALLRSTEVIISLKLADEKGLILSSPNGTLRKMAGRLADNSRYLDVWYPDTQNKNGKNATYDLLIITRAPFDTVLQRLAKWKQTRGFRTIIATTESIYAGTSGADRQEKIRNYIRDRVQVLGIGYVILGGDTAVVPARVAFAMASGYDSLAPGRDSLRADLYYSDLDGSWDANGNGRYGELTDSVDMYPDVIVGRAPINTISDAQTFVRKVIEHEQGAATDFLGRASLWAEMLDYTTDGAAAAEIIDRDFLSPYFRPSEKLYETLGNQTRASTIEAYRQGRHIVNHIGHAWYTSLNVGPGFSSQHEIRAGDFDTIPTGGRWGIIYSIGCMTTAIERNCIAERYVNSPLGGGVAFIGNCSYGWYLPHFAGYASSDIYNQQFFQELMMMQPPSLGLAHAAAKVGLIGASQAQNEYRWVMYALNLIGDPTMAMWTAKPESLEVVCPDSLPQWNQSISISVCSEGKPLAGAMVCLRGCNDVDTTYSWMQTDDVGQAILDFNTMAFDTVFLYVNARNHFPFARRVPTTYFCPYIYLSGVLPDEAIGNNDGLPGPGEKITISMTLEDRSSVVLGDRFYFRLRSIDAHALLVDSMFTTPAPPPGGSMLIGPFLSFWADSSLVDGSVLRFLLQVDDSMGNNWNLPINIRLMEPVPAVAGYRVDDRVGNGNGIPEPGESATIYVKMTNRGKAILDGATIYLTVSDPFVAMTDSTISPPPLMPDSTAAYAFQIHIDPAMPGPWRAPVFDVRCLYAWKEWRGSFAVAMGQVGLADDMESGVSGWQAEGGWHLSTIRSRSPSLSWYFGSEDDSLMPPYSSVDTLQTPAFVVGQSCSLSYWQWHDFVPGWSWGVVEVCGDFGARLLEVVEGSSGGWRNRVHDLSRYQPGTVLSLRFIAVCDSVRSEGWYIDDLNVFGPPTSASREPHDLSGRLLALNIPRPNPATTRTTISFVLPQTGWASLKVYNVQGQLVRTLIPKMTPSAFSTRGGGSVESVIWDCRDGSGRDVPSGVYIIRLSIGTASVARKLTVVR